MPWGSRSILEDTLRNKSNDGPIIWIRPGEQAIPTGTEIHAILHLNEVILLTYTVRTVYFDYAPRKKELVLEAIRAC